MTHTDTATTTTVQAPVTATEHAAALPAVMQEPAPRSLAVIDYAIKVGADAGQLERLFELQVRADEHQLSLMRQKRAFDREDAAERAKLDYLEALRKFKQKCPSVVRLKEVKEGPRAGSKHADLDAVVGTATKHLSEFGLTCTWRVVSDEKDWITIEAKLQHVGGHSEVVQFSGPPDTSGAKNPIQSRKSTVSYLERVTMLLVCGLAEKDADDDGAGGPDQGAADLAVVFADLTVRVAGMATEDDVVKLWGAENSKLAGSKDLHARLKAAVQTRRGQIRKAAAEKAAPATEGAPA